MVARTAQGTNLGATSGPSGAMGADTSYEVRFDRFAVVRRSRSIDARDLRPYVFPPGCRREVPFSPRRRPAPSLPSDSRPTLTSPRPVSRLADADGAQPGAPQGETSLLAAKDRLSRRLRGGGRGASPPFPDCSSRPPKNIPPPSAMALTVSPPLPHQALLGQEVVVTLGDASTRTGIVYNVDPVNFSVALLKVRTDRPSHKSKLPYTRHSHAIHTPFTRHYHGNPPLSRQPWVPCKKYLTVCLCDPVMTKRTTRRRFRVLSTVEPRLTLAPSPFPAHPQPRRPLIKGTQGENRVPARAPPPRRPATPQIRDVHPRGFPTILDFYLTDRRPPPDVSSQLHRRDTTARITCASSPATRSRAWRWWADNARRWSASRPEPPSGGTLDRRRRRRLRL